MNIAAFWTAFCCFVVRSALDFAVFWIAQYYYLRWRGEVEEEKINDDLLLEIPLGAGEDIDVVGQRKMILGSVWRCIWGQQKTRRCGQECKQWFLDEIQNLAVSLSGSASEIQGDMGRLPAYEAAEQHASGVRRRA